MLNVQVSALAGICASGDDLDEIYNSCLNGISSVQNTGLAEISLDKIENWRSQTPEILKPSKATVLGFQSLKQALEKSQWTKKDLKNAGFIYATTTGKIDLWEKILNTRESANLSYEEYKKGMVHQPLGAPLIDLCQTFEMNGPQAQISSSCSAALQALAMGALWIQSGKIEKCIVGTTEINNDLTRVGFNSLRLLSKSVCAPFDANRTGINLGEGASFLLLEKCIANSSQPSWGLISGVGLTSDAFHPTSPHPEGHGSFLAMKKSLSTAALRTDQIDWIYAHGTGSPANDLAESSAIQALFSHQPPVTSTKSIHGHTLGACGILETAIGLTAMKNEILIPNSNLNQVDSQISLQLPVKSRKLKINHFLKNSLGFGGINVSVILSRGES